MCGISGILEYNSSTTENGYLKQYLDLMNQKLYHRGPDDQGVWLHAKLPVGLAQTRLSILDLSMAGHQPMTDGQTGNIITFNGEVFNFKDINNSLFKDETFTSGTDTETLLKLYRKEGVNMFKYMNGMFAFGIWDHQKEELIIARDRSGKKPLYFTEMNGRFVFASELKAILSLPWIKRELDETALYDFLTFNATLPPSTMFKGIYKFKPAHYMRVSSKGIQAYEKYYNLSKTPLSFQNETELATLVKEKLQESVNYRMISDVPVGAFLSGGVDSTAIVALMRENTSQEIKTFTIGFKDQPNYNELEYAKKASKLFNTAHFEKIVEPHDLIEMLPKIVDIYDEPQSDTTAIPIYFISELAKQEGIKVVLNGDGPDELFTGYSNQLRQLHYMPYINLLKKTPKSFKNLLAFSTGLLSEDSPLNEIALRLSNNQEPYWPSAGGIKEGLKSKILSKSYRNRIAAHSSYWYIKDLMNSYFQFSGNTNINDFVDWMAYSGYMHNVVERFLYRSDRLGMAHSIESRSPFLDYKLIEIALSTPSEYKIKNGVAKYILKKSLEPIIPHEFLYRKKMGFCLPINEWAKDTIADYVIKNISLVSDEFDIFNKAAVLKLVERLKRGDTTYTNTVWSIYFLIHWINKWFK
jgi:asparagine synthase (glutamine-hydrolysing)